MNKWMIWGERKTTPIFGSTPKCWNCFNSRWAWHFGTSELNLWITGSTPIWARVDQLLVLGMGNLQPLIGNPYNGYVNPYYWVDDHPLLYGNNGSLDPSTYVYCQIYPPHQGERWETNCGKDGLLRTAFETWAFWGDHPFWGLLREGVP